MSSFQSRYLPELDGADERESCRRRDDRMLQQNRGGRSERTRQDRRLQASQQQTPTSSSSSSTSVSSTGSASRRLASEHPPSWFGETNLPFVEATTNSTLVHQRVSVSDHLAAASVRTGASLPLMIGGRSKCVVNLIGSSSSPSPPSPSPSPPAQSVEPKAGRAQEARRLVVVGPQNMAIRAEQRRQNMSVSVVRPVINTTSQQQQSPEQKGNSIIDDWMSFDKRISRTSNSNLLDELILSSKLGRVGLSQADQSAVLNSAQQFLRSEQEARQQALILKREEGELNRGIKRQHQFVLAKIEERKRHLQIIQSVWVQRDFKHAIEKMVDIYHQGLIFTPKQQSMNPVDPLQKSSTVTVRGRESQLSSLNTSLVVDVVSIIILRPKLWTLEICQLLLPIMINDLLMQTSYEYYVETALKALKLILTHFSSVIKNTLESLKENVRLVGVDLSREDRINKCVACYRLLLEAQTVLASRRMLNEGLGQCKLGALYRELQTLFSSLEASIDLDPYLLLKRSGLSHQARH